MTDPADTRVDRAAPSHVRLTFLILEGYVYLALILGIFLAATAFLLWGVLTRRPFIAIVAILVGGPVAATTGRALRALWFAGPEPTGVDVGPHFGGPLFHTVREIAQRVRAPQVHRILVTYTNNASATQLPRVGVFWPTNTLELGYPLLATLPVDQVRAVIAHELGHMAHAHGRFSSWVHRTRLSWMRLLAILERYQAVPAHVYLLFRFYVPRLQRRASAVSRQQELLADRLAADVAGPDVAAQALVAIDIVGHVLAQTFWPRMFERVQHDPDPPNPFSEMGPEIWEAVDNREQLLDRLLDTDTTESETHPPLRDRLAAIGRPPRWPAVVQQTAVDSFFGARKPELAAALDREWQGAYEREWRRRHEEIRRRRERLTELAALAAPTPEETFEWGTLKQQEGDANGALDLYVAAYRQGHAAGGLGAGRVLLDREDASGVDLIETVIAADAALLADGCSAIADFLERRGRHADAHRYRVRITREATRTKLAHTERAELSVVDRLLPCTETAVDAAALFRGLASEPGVRRAFLATKELRYSAGTQTVLAVLAKDGIDSGLKARLCREGTLPDHVVLVVLGRHDQQLETALGEVSGALIFER